MAWSDFLTKATVKYGVIETTIPASSIKITAKPYLGGGGESVMTDIAGDRFSRFSDPRWHLDIEVACANVSKSAWTTLRGLIVNLASNATSTDIYFSPVTPYDGTRAINVVPVFDDDMFRMTWDENVRNRPVILKFRSRETVTSIPSWMGA